MFENVQDVTQLIGPWEIWKKFFLSKLLIFLNDGWGISGEVALR